MPAEAHNIKESFVPQTVSDYLDLFQNYDFAFGEAGREPAKVMQAHIAAGNDADPVACATARDYVYYAAERRLTDLIARKEGNKAQGVADFMCQYLVVDIHPETKTQIDKAIVHEALLQCAEAMTENRLEDARNYATRLFSLGHPLPPRTRLALKEDARDQALDKVAGLIAKNRHHSAIKEFAAWHDTTDDQMRQAQLIRGSGLSAS